MDTFPDLGALSDAGAEGPDPAAHGGGAGGLLPAPHPARQDRHPARGARQPAAQEARGGRVGDQRRRRAAAHRHPGRQGHPGGRGQSSSTCTAPSAASPTPRARTTARSAGRSSATRRETKQGDTTEVYQVDETGELKSGRPRASDARGRHARDPLGRRPLRRGVQPSPASASTIGRSPEAEVFLDDVTVSRNHALLVRRRDGLYIDDLGSLNGTYVNRRRIESHRLRTATSCRWASTS